MSRRFLPSAALLLAVATGTCSGASDQGAVIEITRDTITLRGTFRTTTLKISSELLVNVAREGDSFLPSAKFTEVKVGRRIAIEYESRNGTLVCTWIRIFPTDGERADAERKEREKQEKEKGDFNFVKPGDEGDKRRASYLRTAKG